MAGKFLITATLEDITLLLSISNLKVARDIKEQLVNQNFIVKAQKIIEVE